MPKKYNRNVYLFVLNHAAGKSTGELLQLVNDRFGEIFTYSALRAYKKNHGIQSGIKGGTVQKGKSLIFTAEIEKFIKENAYGKPSAELTQLVNETFKTSYNSTQISAYKKRHHIITGIDTKFQKGNVSLNKGKKMSAFQYEKCKATMFKKGQIPKNTRPVGSERIDAKDGYLYIKVAEPNKWMPKHRFIWEQANGPIPEGNVVTFLDGNKENIVLENLACITLAENAVLNHMKIRVNEKELMSAAISYAKIKTKISKLKTGNK